MANRIALCVLRLDVPHAIEVVGASVGALLRWIAADSFQLCRREVRKCSLGGLRALNASDNGSNVVTASAAHDVHGQMHVLGTVGTPRRGLVDIDCAVAIQVVNAQRFIANLIFDDATRVRVGRG